MANTHATGLHCNKLNQYIQGDDKYLANLATRCVSICVEIEQMDNYGSELLDPEVAKSDAPVVEINLPPSAPSQSQYFQGNLVTTPIMVKMYYDDYERRWGDGFYPQIVQGSLLNSTDVPFVQTIIMMPLQQKSAIAWIQINNGCIEGLDGNCGQELLQYLNQFADSNLQSTAIFCTAKQQIYPK